MERSTAANSTCRALLFVRLDFPFSPSPALSVGDFTIVYIAVPTSGSRPPSPAARPSPHRTEGGEDDEIGTLYQALQPSRLQDDEKKDCSGCVCPDSHNYRDHPKGRLRRLMPKEGISPTVFFPFRVGVSISYCVAVVVELVLGAIREGGSKWEADSPGDLVYIIPGVDHGESSVPARRTCRTALEVVDPEPVIFQELLTNPSSPEETPRCGIQTIPITKQWP